MCVYINKKLQENNMSIADEFKLKKIPKANYSPNKRTIINTKTGEVHVQKKPVKVGLKPFRLTKRNILS